MSETIEAVYEKGLFRPTAVLHETLRDGQRVRLIIETDSATATPLDLALHVYDGLSEQEIDEVEEAIQRGGDYFEAKVR